MKRFVTAIVCAFVASPAPAQVIASTVSTGFNNLSGINSTGTLNSPYNVNNVSVVGQGAGEPGWNSTWQGGGFLENVTNSNTYEGDGALLLQGTSQVFRTLTSRLTGTESATIELMVKSATGAGGMNFYLMDSSISDSGLRVATQVDPNPNGHWFVLDGNGNGVGNNVDTGIAWTPGVYQQVRVDVNTTAGYWDFYVNGVHYNPGHHLGFRGTPTSIDEVNFLGGTGAPNGIYIDDVNIAPIPEPSSLFLLSAAAGLAVWRRYRASRSA